MILWGLALVGVLLRQGAADQWVTASAEDFALGTLEGVEVSAAGKLRLTSYDGVNLALEMAARSGSQELTRSFSITDGDLYSEWKFDGEPRVMGRSMEIDLGGNRLVTRVRILPGSRLGELNPLFFLRGYRIDVAAASAPDLWIPVAQSLLNHNRFIDTTLDNTWMEFEQGEPRPVRARYVRITVTREDLPNWVIVGEVEVYGTGFNSAGEYTSPPYEVGSEIAGANLGTLFWRAVLPPGTKLSWQIYSSRMLDTQPEWEEIPIIEAGDGTAGIDLQMEERSRYVWYRVLFETVDSRLSPELEEVVITFDRRLIATTAQGSVEPGRVLAGEPVSLTYKATIEVEPQDYGVDLLILNRWGELEDLLIDGTRVPPGGYEIIGDEFSVQRPNLSLRLLPAYRIEGRADIELTFSTAFLKGAEVVTLALGTLAEGADPANLQPVSPRSTGSTLVAVSGSTGSVLSPSSVDLVPRIFRPGPGGGTRIHFDVAKVRVPVPVSVAIFDLSGRRLRTLLDHALLQSGPIVVPFDGYDGGGRVLPPGIYLCRIEVSAQRQITVLRTLGIAY